MSKKDILQIFADEVASIRQQGLYKNELPIVSAQGAKVMLADGREVVNMCANNYLGLGNNARLIEAAKRTYDEKGYGMASVRFICGTQDIHKQLEKKKKAADAAGKPDLNVLFIYNMPFRAIGKMTGGAVDKKMVEGMVDVVNGHFFGGAGKLIGGYFANSRENKKYEKLLAGDEKPEKKPKKKGEK